MIATTRNAENQKFLIFGKAWGEYELLGRLKKLRDALDTDDLHTKDQIDMLVKYTLGFPKNK